MELQTPITEKDIESLHVGDMITISGIIYCGRDAVLPKICNLIGNGELDRYGIDLQGSVIFHTAVSPAGVGPTSSNKLEIEGGYTISLSTPVDTFHTKSACSKHLVIGTQPSNILAYGGYSSSKPYIFLLFTFQMLY